MSEHEFDAYLALLSGMLRLSKSRTSQPLTFDIHGVPTILALDLMLGQFELGFVVREGVVVITSADEADLRGLIRVYQVGDLVGSPCDPLAKTC